ncbi:MAG: hypothetical protein ACPK85_15565 [Methanosarcina sp.]
MCISSESVLHLLSTCGCLSNLTIEDEIKMLEAGRQRMQVQISMIERKIEELKKKI